MTIDPVKVVLDPVADWTSSGVSPNTPMYDMIIELKRQNDEILAARWIYKIESVDETADMLVLLNAAGALGWEYVEMSHGGLVLFRRRQYDSHKDASENIGKGD